MNNQKLTIFDVDNTLISLKKPYNYIWEIFNTHFGVCDEDYVLYKMCKNGEIKYPEWISRDLNMYSEKGANRAVLEKLIKNNTSVTSGAVELLEILKERGDFIGIVSGSVDIPLNIYDLKKYFDKIHINRLNYDSSGNIITEGTYHTDYDGNRKIIGVLETCYHFEIPLTQCTYIGDGDNDIPVADFLNKNGGTSISFNGSDALNRVATLQHNGDFINLKNILL